MLPTSPSARFSTVALLTIVATTALGAQLRPITRDSTRPAVDVNRPPVSRMPGQPGGSLLPPMQKPGTPAAPPAVVESAVAGYEIVMGPTVEVSALATTATSAQCPSNKVALSAGVDFSAPAESQYGLEVLGAWPDGRAGMVRVRNANVLARATVRAYAVCVADIPGMRQVDRQQSTNRSLSRLSCLPNERLAGGGVMGEQNIVIQSSAPDFSADASSHWYSAFSAAGPGTTTLRERLLCAPASRLAGWQIAKGTSTELGFRGTGTVTVMCPGGSVPIGFGVVGDFSTNMIWNLLVPQLSGSVSARVLNRSILRADPNVAVQLQAACVRRA